MIKTTFYNLPLDKRQRLLKAARLEFSKMDFHDASINRIIKEAQISRGSFYTYFDDKYDLVRALLEDYFQMVEKTVDAALKSSNGDVFEMFLSLFDITVSYKEIKENVATFESLFRALQVSDTEPKVGRVIDEQRHAKHKIQMLRQINREKLAVSSDEDLSALVDMLFFLSRKGMIKALAKDANVDDVRKRLVREFEFLKHGAVKPEYHKAFPPNSL